MTKSFNDMVRKQRSKDVAKYNALSGRYDLSDLYEHPEHDFGSVAVTDLKDPKAVAESIYGEVCMTIAHACDNVKSDVEMFGALSEDYYARVTKELIVLLNDFVANNEWR